MLYAGIDVGSITTKAVITDGNRIVSWAIGNTGINPKEAGENVLTKALQNSNRTRSQIFGVGESGFPKRSKGKGRQYRISDRVRNVELKREDIKRTVGTGYGRIALPFVDKTITEISCHARGVYYLNPQVRTIIDIGGQDSKVIKLDEEGNIDNFFMNDKCAAGTGRFLEVISRTLEVELDDMGRLFHQSENPCMLSSTCVVFAESEVVSLLARGQKKEDIIAGLCSSVAKRVGNMVLRVKPIKEFALVGGVAKNTGVKNALETFLECRFVPLKVDPQITGAVGAAVLAEIADR